MLKITDNRVTKRTTFKRLSIGELFEYLESFYIKTGLYETEANAVDLQRGADDIVRLDAEVEPIDAELVISEREDS